MKKVRYNHLKNGMTKLHNFKDGEVFEVVKDTKAQFVILRHGKEATINKRHCIEFFTAIN